MGALADAYATLKTSSFWSGVGKCKGYAVQNPGEAAKIDSYVAALDSGQFATAAPSLATSLGKGLVGMLSALAAQVPPSKPFTVTIVGDSRPGATLTGELL